jgi:2-oxoglutarate dehydrogenase E2 component (dihydrolipoamide succinyltransferase)
MLEVPAPSIGILREIKVADGSTVKSGELLAIIEDAAAAGAGATTSTPSSAASPPPATAPSAPPATASAAAPAPTPAPPTASPPAADVPRTGPAARRVIEQNALAPGTVIGTAPRRRVTKADAMQAAAAEGAAAQAASQAAAAQAAAPPPLAAQVSAARAGRGEKRVPMTRLRARIAERLVQAQLSQALLTTFNEVDLGAVQELRARYKESFEAEHGVKLGLMSFFIKASIEGLKRYPVVNASVENNDIVYHEYFDIGVAVSTERGLMVPVLRDADLLSFAAIEERIAQFATRARSGSITLEELTGGTFSITNGGIFGSLMSTPIVNAPQSAILGMHKIQDRAMVVKGQVTIRPMMYLAVTYDHRLIDGREAVQFLVAVKECLEDPGRLLLGV